MGQLLSRHLSSAAESFTGIISSRKRKREDEDAGSCNEDVLEQSLNTPKRKKLLTTAQYIYQALFKEERSSDIAVCALGKVWHLHKVYLCQSAYFASMFNGDWREATENFINIEITDPKITVDSLYVVFGSLYLDEVVLEPLDIVSTLATATLFQLDGLIEKCVEVMCETTNAETAVSYYDNASLYGVQVAKNAAFKWLLVNLLCYMSKHSKYLREIDIELMTSLVSSPDLCVMQTEFSLYLVLRTWVFLMLFPEWNPEDKMDPTKSEPATYFAKRQGQPAFLETSEGQPYAKAFKGLRIHNLIMHNIDISTLKNDNIIPMAWLHEPLYEQWVHMLQIDHTIDKGPRNVEDSIFYESCMRCGRILQEGDFQKWRWTGFNFGMDLVLITDSRTLNIKRHHRTENERLLSLQVKRNFLIKVTLTSLNELRQIKHSQTTEIKSISLDKNEENLLLVMDRELTYPLLVSVNLLVVTPNRPTEVMHSIQNVIQSPTTTNSQQSNQQTQNTSNSEKTLQQASSHC